jgi:hypothetical protein
MRTQSSTYRLLFFKAAYSVTLYTKYSKRHTPLMLHTIRSELSTQRRSEGA